MTDKTECKERDKSPVEASIGRLRDALEKVSHQVEELDSCLSVILGNPLDEPPVNEKLEPPPSCSLDETIIDFYHLTNSTSTALDVLRQRIKL